jgi:hypothetical protein
MKISEITNATKANIIAVINTGLILLLAFGVDISEAQIAAIMAAVNAVLVLLVGLTYKDSSKRVPD